MGFMFMSCKIDGHILFLFFHCSQASVIRGRVVGQDGTPLIGVRVGVVTQPLYGYTMTRKEG